MPRSLLLIFLKIARVEGQTWYLMVFVYFLSLKQRLRPLGYCATPSLESSNVSFACVPDPDFVSSLEDEDHVYFFFRESAVEYINCGKVGLLLILALAYVAASLY